jgi:hypothetical protein
VIQDALWRCSMYRFNRRERNKNASQAMMLGQVLGHSPTATRKYSPFSNLQS